MSIYESKALCTNEDKVLYNGTYVLSDIKSLHVTYYGWHDLPQCLWIINEFFRVVISAWAFLLMLREVTWRTRSWCGALGDFIKRTSWNTNINTQNKYLINVHEWMLLEIEVLPLHVCIVFTTKRKRETAKFISHLKWNKVVHILNVHHFWCKNFPCFEQ